MTPKQFADQYSKAQGFDDWSDLVKYSYWDKVSEHTEELMKRYALSVLPKKKQIESKEIGLPEFDYSHPDLKGTGFNDCIDQIKKKIG